MVRVSSAGARKAAPPLALAYLPNRRPIQKQSVSRISPAERDKAVISQTSTIIYPKQFGTAARIGLRSASLGSVSSGNLANRVKEEAAADSNNQV